MKKIKTYYTFLFYALYKSMQIVKPTFLTDWKAIAVLGVLEIWTVFSFVVYLIVITKRNLFPPNFPTHPSFYVLVIGITFIKLIVFEYRGQWKGYLAVFDAWPQNKIKKWKIVAWIVMFGIVANLVLSMYLLYQIDWSQYR